VINTVSFLVIAAVLAGLRLPAAPASTRRRGFFADAVAGMTLLATDRLLRALGVGQLLAALSAGAASALLVVLARDHLALPPSGFGLLLGAIGVGAVLGPFLLSPRPSVSGPSTTSGARCCCSLPSSPGAARSPTGRRHNPYGDGHHGHRRGTAAAVTDTGAVLS
jgi:hypothetical protein